MNVVDIFMVVEVQLKQSLYLRNRAMVIFIEMNFYRVDVDACHVDSIMMLVMC